MKKLSDFKKVLHVDVEKILNELKLPYQVAGKNFIIRCVSGLHKDVRPSLHINRESGVFNCSPCGYKGNMITLVSRVTGITTADAYEKLSKDTQDFFGEYVVGHKPRKFEDRKKKSKRVTMSPSFLKINPGHEMFFNYLHERGVTETMINYFDIRCCLVGWFNYRIVFPVYFQNKLVSYAARDILKKEERFEREPDKNDYRPYLFPSGVSMGDYLFNYDNLNQFNPLYLVEGIFDVLNLWKRGYKNSTCIFGKVVSDGQARLLKKFRNIVVIPDTDEKEKKLTLVDSAVDQLSMWCNLFRVDIPEGYDPGNCPDIETHIKNNVSTVKGESSSGGSNIITMDGDYSFHK